MTNKVKTLATSVLFVTYLSTIIFANWTIEEFGMVPVGFSLSAPAGVYVAGLAFTLRDLLHETAGRWTVAIAIAAGSTLSLAIASPKLALASAAAFGFSEFADLAVYTHIRKRRWLLAVAASNMVGLIIDSMLFLWLAFGSWTFLPGQIAGKAWTTIAAIAILAIGRHISNHGRS